MSADIEKEPDELVKRLRIKAGMITMGERIQWGSDAALMNEAASKIEALTARATPSPAPIQQDSCITPTMPCKECNGRGLIGFLTSLRCQYCEGTGRAPTVKASQ